MSAVLRGLIINLGSLQTTDLESITVSGSPANRIWLNHNMLASPSASPFDASITHSQTTTAVATIRTGSRTDTGTANITIDQLKVGLRGFIIHPYARDTPGNIYTPVATPSYTGTVNRQGNSRQVHFRIIPSFRLTINSLSVNTPGSTAWALDAGQSQVTVVGVYAGRQQHGEPDFEKRAYAIPMIQAIAIAPTRDCTAGGESGTLTLRSASGNYPVWLGVGAYPVESNSPGTWLTKQRLPAFDILAQPTTGAVEFPTCHAGSFTPIADDYPEAEA